MFTLFLVAATAAQPPASSHEAANPLYKTLLETGFDVGAGERAKLPAPSVPDGLDAAKQKAAVLAVLAGDQSFDEFTRKSNVAPQLIKFRDVASSDPKAPAKGIDTWFVLHGDLKALGDEKFLDRLLGANNGDGKGKTLTKEDLAKRKIPPVDEKKERFGFIEYDLLEKAHLKLTGRVVWSRTPESVVVAGEVDPRFAGDPEYPNQWQSIVKEGGQTKLGPASPWSGAVFYLKMTKMAEPAGSLFCEQHIVLIEPHGWFNGANLLRSKLPLVIQNHIRTMRKEWGK